MEKELKEEVEKARMNRRAKLYTEPRAFVNPDGTKDEYFPIEDLLYCGSSWKIFYTEKQTKRVKSLYAYEDYTLLKRDLNENQLSFIEMLGINDGSSNKNCIIHLGEKKRIEGGVGKRYGYKTSVQYQINAIDLGSKK